MTPSHRTRSALERLKETELRDLCAELGLDAAGDKAALAERIRALRRSGPVQKPSLIWPGKDEEKGAPLPPPRLSAPERLCPEEILRTLNAFGKERGRPPLPDPPPRAFHHGEDRPNRLILGDAREILDALLSRASMSGRVQMIYLDPPYGVDFASAFRPFASRGDSAPRRGKVRAYRDAWAKGLPSYLTFLLERLRPCREILHPSGSIFVQIGDDHAHHVREVLDEVFGQENFLARISFQTATNRNTRTIQRLCDNLLWYAKSAPEVKRRTLYRPREPWEIERTFDRQAGQTRFKLAELGPVTAEERTRLENAGRLSADGKYYKRLASDFPYVKLDTRWTGTVISTYSRERLYAVQTSRPTVERCLLLSTDPGDVVLDPMCGSGTTPWAAEKWGRRWIAADVSRLPVALTRQRMLTATFPPYALRDETRGPAGGFVYKQKRNRKGDPVGGRVPHLTKKIVAAGARPPEEILVDRPEIRRGPPRVSGPFTVEAAMEPAPDPGDESGTGDSPSRADEAFAHRVLEALQRAPVARLPGGRTLSWRNVRPADPRGAILAEADLDAPGPLRAAFAVGPARGAVDEAFVRRAAREADAGPCDRLLVTGMAVTPGAREAVASCGEAAGMPASYVQARPDLLMGDLLADRPSSEIFSVVGLVRIEVAGEGGMFRVRLLGIACRDPATGDTIQETGPEVPAWFLDTDFDGRCFCARQAFFPRSGAWTEARGAFGKRGGKEAWDRLSGTESAPFASGARGRVAVKAVDERGNELMAVRALGAKK